MSTVARHVTSLVSVPHRACASLQQAPAHLLPSAFCFPHPPLPTLRCLSVPRSLYYTLPVLVKFLLYWARIVGTYLLSPWLRGCPPALVAHFLSSFLHRSGPLSGPGALGLRPKNYQIITFNANIFLFDVPRESATQSSHSNSFNYRPGRYRTNIILAYTLRVQKLGQLSVRRQTVDDIP